MNSFHDEVLEKWGGTDAYKEHAQRTKGYSKDQWDALAAGLDQLMAGFALCMEQNKQPDSDAVQSQVKLLQNHITDNFYHCTKEILFGLGQMYVADERFKTNIDRHGDGTANFISRAIAIYCGK